MLKIVYIKTPQCVPCKQKEPLIRGFCVARDVPLEEIDAHANPQAANRYRVQSVPTVIILKDGQVFQQRSGAGITAAWLEEVFNGTK